MIMAVFPGATDAFARFIGWLITELLFSRAGLWLLLSAALGGLGFFGGAALDRGNGGAGVFSWLLGGTCLVGALFLFHWLLSVGTHQRYEGDKTVAELEDEAELSLHERFLRRGR